MKKGHLLRCVWMLAVMLAAPVAAQSPAGPEVAPDPLLEEAARDALFAVRRQVLAELGTEIEANLPDGYLAILPPEISDSQRVDAAASVAWETAWAEALRRVRSDVRLTERGELEAILREQKFGDSPYADGGSAVEVGKIVAARSLLLTTLREFRYENPEVRLHLETRLLDVETGEILWSRDLYRGVLPPWIFWPLLGAGLLVMIFLLGIAWWVWERGRRARLVRTALPRRRARLRVDVDSLARSLTAARERLFRASQVDQAVAVQRASEELEPVLDRVRHALPGGAVKRTRARDLKRALRHFDRIGGIVTDLRLAAEAAGGEPSDGQDLALLMGRGARDLRSTVDAYRGLLP